MLSDSEASNFRLTWCTLDPSLSLWMTNYSKPKKPYDLDCPQKVRHLLGAVHLCRAF